MPEPVSSNLLRELVKVEYSDPAGSFAGWFIFATDNLGLTSSITDATKAKAYDLLVQKGFGASTAFTVSMVYVAASAEYAVYTTGF